MGFKCFAGETKLIRNALFLLAFFVSESIAAENRPKIIASIPPLGLLVQDLAGKSVELEVLLSGGASPHDFSLTIGQAMALQEADILVWVGPETEPYLAEKRLQASGLAMSVERNEHHSAHHSHAALHPWLGLAHVREFLPQLSDALNKKLSEDKQIKEEQFGSVVQNLNDVEAELKQLFTDVGKVKFVVYHDAYDEFIEYFQLPEPFALTRVPHEQLSVKRVAELHATMGDATCLISESGEAQAAKRYADLLGLSLVEVDLLASNRDYASYAEYLREVGRAFSRCFAKKRT